MSCLILGVDEAGRGPLAGPVAVGVVLVEEGFDLLATFPYLNDSKKLSEKKREAIFEQLLVCEKEGSVSFCVKSVDAATIDKAGISPSVRSAVHAGIRALTPDPTGVKVYLDGLLHAPNEYEQETVVGGDALIPAIMLASIAAKVSRDRLMVRLAEEYPEYGFEAHKGYGTKAHQAAIRTHGLSPLHRRSFCRAFA
ncbi:ribonuclease HII [Patescibacteria group bacterium]|nr:ribonuclease HII [Patescibacteria group bacterium]